MTTAAAPRPVRRTLPRSTRRLLRVLVTSAWLFVGLAALAGVAALLFFHRGDAEGSARKANAEIEALLERGERVEWRVPVLQRHWWDSFRVTHGVLAATDQRLLYVGVPPEPLLQRGFEPQEYLERSLPYDRPLSVQFARLYLGTRTGVRLTGSAGGDAFAFAPLDRPRVDSVLAVLSRRQATLRAASEAERRATEATAAASRRAIYHLVQRGEALDFIARRYGVPSDSLVAWNALTSTRITAGRRLLVKPEVP